MLLSKTIVRCPNHILVSPLVLRHTPKAYLPVEHQTSSNNQPSNHCYGSKSSLIGSYESRIYTAARMPGQMISTLVAPMKFYVTASQLPVRMLDPLRFAHTGQTGIQGKHDSSHISEHWIATFCPGRSKPVARRPKVGSRVPST